jgi:hypothetical protein
MRCDNTLLTDYFGEPVRALVLSHSPQGPVIYTPIGKSLTEQLRYIAGLAATWATTGCCQNYSVWVKPNARSPWEPA